MAIYGYARVSTRDQNVDRQIDALKAFPLAEQDIYIDYFTGATFERPRYQELLGCLRAGDVLVIKSIDRLGRNYTEILDQWHDLTRVVEPDDVDAVAVQPGRDLVTLLTCHPYGTNRYRMLVTCERTDDARQAPASLVADALTQLTPDLTSDSPLLTLEGVLRLIGLGVLMALGATLVGQALRRRLRRTRLGTREGAPGDAPGRTLTRSSSRAGDGEPPRPAGGHIKT